MMYWKALLGRLIKGPLFFLGFIITHLKQAFILSAIVVFLYPSISILQEKGIGPAIIELGKSAALPDIQIAEGMKQLLNGEYEGKAQELKIWLGVSSGLSVLYLLGFTVFKITEKTGGFVWFNSMVTTFAILALIEAIYLWSADAEFRWPFYGVFLLISHPLVFINPIFPILRIIGWSPIR